MLLAGRSPRGRACAQAPLQPNSPGAAVLMSLAAGGPLLCTPITYGACVLSRRAPLSWGGCARRAAEGGGLTWGASGLVSP